MVVFHIHLRNEHLSGWASEVGGVTFLQNHYRVPHMSVHKVNPYIGVSWYLSPVALQCTLQHPRHSKEGYHIYPGFCWGEVGGCLTEGPDLYHSGPGIVSPSTPPPILPLTMGTLPTFYVSLASYSCKPPPIVYKPFDSSDRPSPLYYWFWCGDPPCQRGPS